MSSPQPQHSILTAAVFPSLLPLSFSLPQKPAIFDQLQEPLVYNYIVAPRARGDLTDRSKVVTPESPADERPSMRADTKWSPSAVSRFAIE
ncbi:hypothetical protein GJ744_003930 [Endocarpon pusillum]|uniref:Uncharacterized protein n=1 Tax=Endocarpon pusillum TaxID=364733 RepID=A0A8H7E1U4_9EURO|nr:hypothetical protein GJ744_003930 [Endocarpon pusillum]